VPASHDPGQAKAPLALTKLAFYRDPIDLILAD